MINSSFIIQFIFIVCVFYQICYWLYFYYPLIKHLKKNVKNSIIPNEYLPPVSVLICAKNERDNLIQNLPAVLNQNYPVFEVIVIDDYSTDETLKILQKFAAKHQHLTIIEKQNFIDLPGKKAALEAGIKQSKYDILLLTDADCKPVSNYWIKCMASKFDDNTEIVLGYGPYLPESTFLNRFTRYETYQTFFNYAGFSLRGMTYMGVGRNLAYKKKLFAKTNGFATHRHIASGDDDLFIAQAATINNTKLCVEQQAWCYSKAKQNWSAYIRQKQRHVSTSKAYKFSTKALLAIYAISNIIIYTKTLYCFFEPLAIIIVLFISRACVLYIIHRNLYNYLNETDGWVKSSLFDCIFTAYYFFSFRGLLNKMNSKW